MLPFSPKRHEVALDNAEDQADGSGEMDMLDAVAHDIIEAIHNRDKTLLRGALEALVMHIQEQDEYQDHEEFA